MQIYSVIAAVVVFCSGIVHFVLMLRIIFSRFVFILFSAVFKKGFTRVLINFVVVVVISFLFTIWC